MDALDMFINVQVDLSEDLVSLLHKTIEVCRDEDFTLYIVNNS